MAAPSIFCRLKELIICFILFCYVNCDSDSFFEDLYIKPLPSGHVYTHFQFTINRDSSSTKTDQFRHFHLFPRSLGETLAAHDVAELHFSLTQGIWRYDKWGYPFRGAPPGAELWVWFQGNAANVTQSWKNLANSLSGQFCASLNFIDSINTVTPGLSFPPYGAVTPSLARNISLLRYSALPKESVCTENLTPWKKLLPCDTKAGLSQLLSAIRLFSANYFSLALDVRPLCKDESCVETSLELRHTLSIVFNPLQEQIKQDWSLLKLFGTSVTRSCPLATQSLVFVDLVNNQSRTEFSLSLEPSKVIEKLESKQKIAVYDIAKILGDGSDFSLTSSYKKSHIYWTLKPPQLYASRYLTGYGLENGGIRCDIHNSHPQKEVRIVYLDIVPWFLRVYAHTLKITCNGQEIRAESFHFRPGKDRLQPHHLELVLRLPPSSVTHISFDYELAFLKWTEYPPDANHGFYVNSAVITAVPDDCVNSNVLGNIHSNYLNTTQQCPHMHIYTDVLLVTLPTPDFSMPYNVICLTCTVVALAFGPIHNITTKRLTPIDRKKSSLLDKVKNFFGKSTSKEESHSKKQN